MEEGPTTPKSPSTPTPPVVLPVCRCLARDLLFGGGWGGKATQKQSPKTLTLSTRHGQNYNSNSLALDPWPRNDLGHTGPEPAQAVRGPCCSRQHHHTTSGAAEEARDTASMLGGGVRWAAHTPHNINVHVWCFPAPAVGLFGSGFVIYCLF